MITLIINGQAREVVTALTLPTLLTDLGLAEKPVVVELNQQALSPSEFDRELKNGDHLEIITVAAGG